MNETKIPKMKVRLGEENELKFSLSIKGSTSDASATQPRIRFMVTETKTGTSVCFPMSKLEEGTMGVTIPDLPHVFKEGAEYTGQVEVIVGNRWFNPTTVGLVFEREMKVEAAPLLEEETNPRLRVEDLQEALEGSEGEDEFASFIKPEPTPAKKKSHAPLDEEMARGVLFTEKPLVPAKPARAPSVAVQTPVKKPMDSGLQKVKNNLKSMISEAWDELAE